jgi:transcriptional regulator with XRE-family HTH domain
MTKQQETRLAARRRAKGFTLADLEGLTGLDRGFLSRLERGLKGARPETKVVIARALGASVGELFEAEVGRSA